MDNIRIAVLDTYNGVLAMMDNDAPGALHYYDDELHQYLKGSANTYTFKSDAKHEDSIHLSAGNKLAFRYRKKDYYLNIVRVIRDELEVEVEAYSLSLELLNEWKGPYKTETAMSFVQYMNVLDPSKTVEIGVNEVSDKSISNEWTGEETLLSRLFSLANVFDAEIEFSPRLSDNYSLDKIIMNVYRKHADGVQGIGRERNDIVLRYGKDVSGVKKTEDITDLCTAIIPVGRNGINLRIYTKVELDEKLRIQYATYPGDMRILAVQERDRFPSNIMTGEYRDRYIEKYWSYDTDNVNVLYGQALAELKKNSVPQVKYEVDGYFDTDIGDTVRIEDVEYNPPLYLQARVTEQSRSFTDPSRNQTTFDNFKELQSQIDPSLLAAMNALIEANKTYTCSILSDNGIIFKNGVGNTTLTASVMDVGTDVTDNFVITWEKDGVSFATGKSITISASDVDSKAVYRFAAKDSNDITKGFYEVTVTDITEGADARVYYLEISDNIIRRYMDDSLSVAYIDMTACYRMGTNAEKYTFAGRFKIEQTSDGKTWTTLYQSTADESTKRYYLRTILGDSAGNALGDSIGNALGNNSNDVTNIRCQLLDSSGSLIDVKSIALVKDGDPTGVIESDTEPTLAVQGQLWKYTGQTTAALMSGVTYRRNEPEWEIYELSAKNIKAETLAAITADLGTVNAGVINGVEINGSVFESSFDAMTDYTRKKGDVTIGNGTIVYSYERYSRVSTSAPWALSNDGNITIGAQDGIRFEEWTSGEANSVTALLTASTVDWMQSELNMLSSLFTGFVAKGRANVTSTQANWLNILAVPGYSAANRYFCLVNCNSAPLMGYVRNDGRLIAYGPTVVNGTTYQVDYVIFTSQ